MLGDGSTRRNSDGVAEAQTGTGGTIRTPIENFLLGLLLIFGILVTGCIGTKETLLPEGGGDVTVLETASQMITAAQGGTVKLPSGSSVSIQAGTFATDKTVALSLVSSLPKQPPSGFITGVGPALVLSLAPRQAAQTGIVYRTSQAVSREDTPASRDVKFVLNLGSGGLPTGVVGSAPIANVVDLMGGDNFIGIRGAFDPIDNTATFYVPLLRTQEVQSVTVGLANLRREVEYLPVPGAKIWTGSRWADGTSGFDPSKKTLVLVHGMLSSVEHAFGDAACIEEIMRRGGYEQVVGFNYDWTQGIEKSGEELAEFLKSLRVRGSTQVDIEAHSEGVPVSLAAAAKTDIPIGNMVLLGGPIMGTPAATVGAVAQAGLLGAYSALGTVFLNWPIGVLPNPRLGGRETITLQDLLNGPFASDLRPDSKALEDIRREVRERMAQEGTSLSKTRLVLVAGTDPEGSPEMQNLGRQLKSLGLFRDEPFDGIVGRSSALGEGSGFDPTRLTTSSYPLSHTQLECDPNVIRDVGVAVTPPPPPPTPPAPLCKPKFVDMKGTVTKDKAEITWLTDIPANSTLFWGRTAPGSDGRLERPSYETSHPYNLRGLLPGTTYRFAIKACCQGGNCTTGIGAFETEAEAAPSLTTWRGTWKATSDQACISSESWTATFRIEGERLSGRFDGGTLGRGQISGRVRGDRVSWSIIPETRDLCGPIGADLQMEGTIMGNVITGEFSDRCKVVRSDCSVIEDRPILGTFTGTLREVVGGGS